MKRPIGRPVIGDVEKESATYWVPKDIVKRVRKAARREKVSASAWISDRLAEYFGVEKVKRS